MSPSRMGTMSCCHLAFVTPHQCKPQSRSVACAYWMGRQWTWRRGPNLPLALSEFARLEWALHYSSMVSGCRGGFIWKLSQEIGGLGLRCLSDLVKIYLRLISGSLPPLTGNQTAQMRSSMGESIFISCCLKKSTCHYFLISPNDKEAEALQKETWMREGRIERMIK